jgi:mannitol-1-phosphate/altronate dehydrogenase
VFGIPDVITSNMASPESLAEDPLSLVTEDGVCFVDARASEAGGDCRYVEEQELTRQWRAKLYLHNTPHAVAAYLGAIAGARYLHEAMRVERIREVVSGTMEEMAAMLVARFGLEPEFVRWYADKELGRFSSELLYDPIDRVAREPFRKLGHRDRLLGAANLCLGAGVVPDNLLLGIMSAFAYDNDRDPDFYIRHLVNALKPSDFLSIIIRLRPAEALTDLLLERWDSATAMLRTLES